MRYNPLVDPDPVVWLGMDEDLRIVQVQDYHQKKKISFPNALLHASIHVVVENQIALDTEGPVKAKLQQLQEEGLNRHESLHAIGSVLAEHFQQLLSTKKIDPAAEASYFKKLEKLTVESWQRDYGSEDQD